MSDILYAIFRESAKTFQWDMTSNCDVLSQDSKQHAVHAYHDCICHKHARYEQAYRDTSSELKRDDAWHPDSTGTTDLSSPYLAAMKARVEEPVLRQYIMVLHCEQIVPRLFRISH